MAQRHELNGEIHEFPDTFTEEQVQQALRSIAGGPEPVDEGFSFSNMVSNIPSSAANVLGDMAQTIMNPIDTLQATGRTLMGAGQLAQRNNPLAINPFGVVGDLLGEDYTPYAESAGEFLGDRYGGVEEAMTTLEEDPVGAGMDVVGLLTGANPTVAARLNPITRGAGAMLQRGGEGIMSSATKFGTTLSPTEVSDMTRLMLNEGLSPNMKGSQKLNRKIQKQVDTVDSLLAEADKGGMVSVERVLDRLQALRQERGSSLLSGGQDMDYIDGVIDAVRANADRMGKNFMDASDLQGLKRELYDNIAWDARRGVAETPLKEQALRTMARGAKEEIEGLAPEIKGVNQKLGDYLELRPNLERSVRRIENRDAFGMTDAFALGTGGGLGYLTGSPLPVVGAAAIELTSNPKISPMTAHALYRMGKGAETSSIGQALTTFPYLGAQFYYAGEAAAFEDELTGE